MKLIRVFSLQLSVRMSDNSQFLFYNLRRRNGEILWDQRLPTSHRIDWGAIRFVLEIADASKEEQDALLLHLIAQFSLIKRGISPEGLDIQVETGGAVWVR